LQLDGKPAAGVPLEVRATSRTVTTSRKRMVGGFYSYDNKTDTKDLGSVCSGKSDERGLLLCEAKLGEPGEVELVVTATDPEGHKSQAASSVWVTRQGELWFGGEDHDRIDLLPEKKAYQPGDTRGSRCACRSASPPRWSRWNAKASSTPKWCSSPATTRRSACRSGRAGAQRVRQRAALRGRLREVPWYSFFTWGFKAPREWWAAYRFEGRDYVAPTALVDLSKPAFRLGVSEIRVGTRRTNWRSA
jgi:hypothetical protein